MPATIAGSHLGPDTHANRPAANATGQPFGALYSCTTHGLIYKTDGSTWATYATLGAGIADQGTFTYFDAQEAAAPGTPASTKARLYAKADGRFYSKDDAGVEYGPFDAGGGSDPRDFPAAWTLDDVALGGGILFNEAAGLPTGMTAVGTIASTDYQSMPGLDVLLDGKEGLYVADPGGDLEVMLHFSDTLDNGGMFGIAFADNSGNGHCFVQYANFLYQMALTAWEYSGTGFNVAATPDFINTFGHQWIAVKRVGTTLTARISLNGTSLSAATTGVTNSTSTRIAVGRWYTGNGGKPVRFHRWVIATPDLGF